MASEKRIDVTIYDLKPGVRLYVYSGKWCAPCQKIKPVVEEFAASRGLKGVDYGTLSKDTYVSTVHSYVPFFSVQYADTGVEFELQSSQKEEVLPFIERHL
jgi:thiol-disulfide isomerase/thioredoxin